MDPRESDPTGANSMGGAAGLEDDASSGGSGEPGSQAESVTPGVDQSERQAITSGTAATSEVADPDAQHDAEAQGDGTPLPQ